MKKEMSPWRNAARSRSGVPIIASASAFSFFFFNDTPTTEIYPLSLHAALPICRRGDRVRSEDHRRRQRHRARHRARPVDRSEEHTSELQSRLHIVCPHLLD